jgi:hypothetical protein
MTIMKRLAAAALLVALAPAPVFATEFEPNEFVTVPPGTTASRALPGLWDHQGHARLAGFGGAQLKVQ